MAGPEIQANAISTALRGFPLRSAPGWFDIAAIVLFGLLPALGGLTGKLFWTLGPSLVLGAAYVLATGKFAFDQGWILNFVYPTTALAAVHGRRDRRPLPARSVRAGARARRLLTVRARGRRRTGARADGLRPPARRRLAREHGHVHRPARLHDVLGSATAGAGHRVPQRLPRGDDRRDPRSRRDARLLRGRRDHGRLRGPDRAAGSRRPGRSRRRARCSPCACRSSTPGFGNRS